MRRKPVMSSFQTISSGSVNPSRLSGDKICKVCGKGCVIRLSYSSSNPNREYYGCPTPMEEGGHGWMEWVSARGKTQTNTVEHLGNQVAYCEAKLKLVEEILRMERQRYAMLGNQLERERLRMKYTKFVLKGLFAAVCFYYFVFSEKGSK